MSRLLSPSVVLAAVLCSLALVPEPTRAEGQHNRGELEAGAPTSKVHGDEDSEIKVTTVSKPGTAVKAGRAEGIVNASLDSVRSVVEDYGGYEKFMPHFRASRVLSQRGTSALVYMQASIAKDTMTLWAQLKVSAKPNAGNTRIIEAKMVQGNMDAMFARWELTPLDTEHTLVAFQVLMDPKVPLPASLVTNENEKASQKTIRALRRVVAERATLAANDKH
jgi:ribosome-associated toxin RatA of RatAB toxin-antitoxin module